MADIFLSEDLKKLLWKKKVVFIGDSNVRSYYYDMLCLHQHSEIISQKALKKKMETSMFGDCMVVSGERNNGRRYQEERVFESKNHYYAFYFITRVFNENTERVIKKVAASKPDVIVINSCFWDMSRWGPFGVEEFKVNLTKLMSLMNSVLDKNCLVIWVTAPPLAGRPYGGFLLVQLDFMKYCLRFHVLEANNFSRKIVVQHGYDVLDLHYHLRMQVHMRCADGVHWPPLVVRYITNLILTHISLAWGTPLPHRCESVVTERVAQTIEDEDEPVKPEITEPIEKKPLRKPIEKPLRKPIEKKPLRKPIEIISNTWNANKKRSTNKVKHYASPVTKPIKKHSFYTPPSKKKKNKNKGNSSYRQYSQGQRLVRAHKNIRVWRHQELDVPQTHQAGSSTFSYNPFPDYPNPYADPIQQRPSLSRGYSQVQFWDDSVPNGNSFHYNY